LELPGFVVVLFNRLFDEELEMVANETFWFVERTSDDEHIFGDSDI
jgi:hypothetical protein